MSVYQDIGGGYSFALLRVGMVVRNPAGREIYVQPGDDEAAMRKTIVALDEMDDGKLRDHCVDVVLGEYFA